LSVCFAAFWTVSSSTSSFEEMISNCSASVVPSGKVTFRRTRLSESSSIANAVSAGSSFFSS